MNPPWPSADVGHQPQKPFSLQFQRVFFPCLPPNSFLQKPFFHFCFLCPLGWKRNWQSTKKKWKKRREKWKMMKIGGKWRRKTKENYVEEEEVGEKTKEKIKWKMTKIQLRKHERKHHKKWQFLFWQVVVCLCFLMFLQFCSGLVCFCCFESRICFGGSLLFYVFLCVFLEGLRVKWGGPKGHLTWP